jgi:hypothetical protein
MDEPRRGASASLPDSGNRRLADAVPIGGVFGAASPKVRWSVVANDASGGFLGNRRPAWAY